MTNLFINQVQYSDVYTFANHLTSANKEFEYDYPYYQELVKKYFECNKDQQFKLSVFVKFFQTKRTFKIKIESFINIILKSICSIYEELERKIKKIFEICDIEQTGILPRKKFEQALELIFSKTENTWKINELFKQAATFNEQKEYLIKEEFIIFCLNNSEVIYKLIHDKNIVI